MKSMDDVIRILWKFNELGYFKYAKGIIFGRFGKEVSNTYENVIDYKRIWRETLLK